VTHVQKRSVDVPVIVGWNGVGDPGRVRISVNDTDRRDVVQRALVKQNVVLQRIETHDQIRAQDRPIIKLFLESRNVLILFVDHLGPTLAQDLLPVRYASRDPALEQVVALGHLRGLDDGPVLAIACSYE
jgi:hypothetical protein